MKEKIKALLLVVVTFTAIVFLAWGPPPTLFLSREERAAYAELRSAWYFAGPAIGYGGQTPPEIAAFRRFAAHPNGAIVFRYLLLRGSTPARLYALAGLNRTDPLLFSVAVQPFKVWPGQVTTFFGCVVGGEKVSELVASRGPNPARLQRGETLEQWWERHGRASEWSVDIAGGGYSSMFLDPPRRRTFGPAV